MVLGKTANLILFLMMCFPALGGTSSTYIFDIPSDSAQIEKLHNNVDKYIDLEDDWLSSRLQMFWDSKATDVYINGEFFDHAEGSPAPAPTVKLAGARSHGTNYARPSLDELQPYHEDARGMYLANKSLPGQPKEWAPIRATGTIIQSINQEIAGKARDAAILWLLTKDERYARIAANVFDTYITGIYYRNVPYDLNHGHQQTLVGMASFEVIHEDILHPLAAIYDYLRPWLLANKPGKKEIYDAAFKKWADLIIENGVPQNNWNLMQLRFILSAALVLDSDEAYADHKGREYYSSYMLDKSGIRQWSLRDLADFGFDTETGIWGECAGYSLGVVSDFTELMMLIGRHLNIDLAAEIPVIADAVEAVHQYLFPDGRVIGFGDTHPGTLSRINAERMIANAQQFDKPEQEARFRRLLQVFDSALPIDSVVTPTFYAPNASWLVMRNGTDQSRSLMVALNASKGNHMHANGLNIELYGRGYRLGPDAGIGKTLYSGQDYLEYYSQFPSHNTVCVDGISAYPVMGSNHGMNIDACYPPSALKTEYRPVQFVQASFREPETDAAQRRQLALITTSDSTGYYVDVFRSRKNEGGDKTHDYFYHNMGQKMAVRKANGNALTFAPTEELAFAGGHLFAYSYIYDKQVADGSEASHTQFTIEMPDSSKTSMDMWINGADDRRIFKALSPMTEGLSRMPNMPYDIKSQPTLTFVARQNGEAWNRPFAAIFQPTSSALPGSISTVSYPPVKSDNPSALAIEVAHENGNNDLIISSDSPATLVKTNDIEAKALFAFANPDTYFICNGTSLSTPNIKIGSATASDILIKHENGKWMYTATQPCKIKINNKTYQLPISTHFSPILTK